MDKKLVIYSCNFLIPEIAHIIKNGNYDDIRLQGFQENCAHNANQIKNLSDKIALTQNEDEDIFILGNGCQAVPIAREQDSNITLIQLEQCFEIFLNRETVAHYIARGYYLVSNGWLRLIDKHIKNWGFKNETAKVFFGESMKGILLLDTQIGDDYLHNLERLSEYMGLPYEILPVGLSHCKTFIDYHIFNWRNITQNLSYKHKLVELSRQSADYSVIFNQLETIVNLSEEREIIEKGFELLNVLYAPSNIVFTRYFDGDKERFEFSDFHQASDEDKIESFEIKIYYADSLMGIYEINDIKFPQFIKEYKKTGEIINYLFGLAIANSRKYKITVEQKNLLEIYSKDLEEVNRTKDKFFSIIAHDLKSPFNSILGFSQILDAKVKNNDLKKIEEYTAIISESSKQAMDLLTNLMEWSQSQKGRMEFKPENIDLGGLIDAMIQILNKTAQQKHILISKTLPQDLYIYGDKHMLATVLRNLISNAIKFTHTNGIIKISAELNSEELTISILDNGVGIEKERSDKIFQIDENHSSLGTENEKGTGLGLILCKEFVEKHEGKIWMESELGKGSTFHFTIPLNNSHSS